MAKKLKDIDLSVRVNTVVEAYGFKDKTADQFIKFLESVHPEAMFGIYAGYMTAENVIHYLKKDLES